MGFLNGRHPAWIKTLPICGVLSKQSFYKLFIAGTATEANRDILFINCAPLIARSHQLPIHMDIKPRVLNLLRLIFFQQHPTAWGGSKERGLRSCLFMPCPGDWITRTSFQPRKAAALLGPVQARDLLSRRWKNFRSVVFSPDLLQSLHNPTEGVWGR